LSVIASLLQKIDISENSTSTRPYDSYLLYAYIFFQIFRIVTEESRDKNKNKNKKQRREKREALS
jgi:hypothetical protein